MNPPTSDTSVLGRAIAKLADQRASKAQQPPPLRPGQSSTSRWVLHALQRKHIYAGTVPGVEIDRRRARNKAARRSRRINRVRAR